MNENLDLTQILANAPKGTKLFSIECGYVEFSKISTDDYFPIVVKSQSGAMCYTRDGYASMEEYRDKFAEQSLYPAHDQRDWSKFVPTWETKKEVVEVTLHPFDKVLVRATIQCPWEAKLITFITDEEIETIDGNIWDDVIPYNKDTAHLLKTRDKCPIDYEIEFSKEFKED